jgi:hypothetical protein
MYYVPKRRVPVVVWMDSRRMWRGHLFLDQRAGGEHCQTVLEKLNENVPFIPLAVAEGDAIELIHKPFVLRITPGASAERTELFQRDVRLSRQEAVEVVFRDGSTLMGTIWMALSHESQRVSDFLNDQAGRFFPLLAGTTTHLVNAASVMRVRVLQPSPAVPLAPQREPLNPLDGAMGA